MVECSNCKANFLFEEIRVVDVPVAGFLCPICQKYAPEIHKGQEIICTNHPPFQEPLVAIGGFHLIEIESFKSKRRIIEVKTQKHKAVLRYLNIIAQKEDSTFLSIPKPGVRAFILSKVKPVGYISFTKKKREYEGVPVIRQLFVKQEARRRGHATELVKYLLERQCYKSNSQGNSFLIESPNRKTLRLLEKLGFLKRVGQNVTLINCSAISSGL